MNLLHELHHRVLQGQLPFGAHELDPNEVVHMTPRDPIRYLYTIMICMMQ